MGSVFFFQRSWSKRMLTDESLTLTTWPSSFVPRGRLTCLLTGTVCISSTVIDCPGCRLWGFNVLWRETGRVVPGGGDTSSLATGAACTERAALKTRNAIRHRMVLSPLVFLDAGIGATGASFIKPICPECKRQDSAPGHCTS